MVKLQLWQVVLYGCETLTLRRAQIDKLEAVELWIWRQLERACWQDRITNEEVLQMVNEKMPDKNKKGKEKELDKTCVKGSWTVEKCAGGKNIGENRKVDQE